MRSRSKHKPWTEADKQYMRDHYATMHPKDMAIALDRTVSAVRLCASRVLHIKCEAPRDYPKKPKKELPKREYNCPAIYSNRFNRLLSVLVHLRKKIPREELSTMDLVDRALKLIAQGEIDLGA